jgi:hypothetical protein
VEQDPKKIVIVTQNEVGIGFYPNGWYRRPDGAGVCLLQGFNKHNPREYIKQEITSLINQISVVKYIDKTTHFVVYLGDDDVEKIIEHMSQFSVQRITYVLCPCEIEVKRRLIARAGQSAVKIIEPEGNGIAHYKMLGCGGQAALNLIFESFFLTGTIPYEAFA